MTTNPSSTTKYVGIAVTNSPTAPPYTDFTWSKYVGEDGAQGPQGIQGPKGDDGQPTYTWIKYADTPTSGMSDYPDGKKYIGMAFNKTTEIESNDYSDYQWSLMPQNIEIGGRNLVRDTSDEYRTASHSQWYAQLALIELSTVDLKPGDTVTFSFYAKTGSDGGSLARLRWEDESGANIANSHGTQIGANSEGLVYVTAKVPTDAYRVRLVSNNVGNSNPYTSEYKKLKLERGDTPTDWTPAPEDIDQNISDSQEYLRGEIDEVNEKVDEVIGLVGEEPVANIKQQLQDAFDRELEAIRTALYGEEGDETESILSRLSELNSDTAALYTNLGEQTALIETLTGKISIEGDSILIGDAQASKGIRIKPDEIAFLEGESKVAWITGGMLYIDAGVFLTRLKIGNHVFQSVDGNPDITIVGYEP
jgi:hypothetical protein